MVPSYLLDEGELPGRYPEAEQIFERKVYDTYVLHVVEHLGKEL